MLCITPRKHRMKHYNMNLYTNKIKILGFVLILFLSIFSPGAEKYPVLTGPYLGQKLPGEEPAIFAPGIINTGIPARDIAMMPDGSEIYFTWNIGQFTYSTILVTRYEKGKWTEPEVAPFASNPGYKYLEPFISPDGKSMFFASDRPVEKNSTSPGNMDIWKMNRTPTGWSEPENLGVPINSSKNEFFPSVTKSGAVYFTRDEPNGASFIYRSRLVDGKYSEPKKLPVPINSSPAQFNAFISPDETYMILPVYGRKDSLGSTDYYVIARNADDTWGELINLGEKINTSDGNEYSPYISPDGKYFFFMTSRKRGDFFKQGEVFTHDRLKGIYNSYGNGNSCIYWVDANIIYRLLKTVSVSK